MPSILAHFRRLLRPRRGVAVAGIILAGVAAIGASLVLDSRAQADLRRTSSDAAVHALERELAVRETALLGARGLIAASRRVDGPEFRRFGDLALGDVGDAVWHPLVRASERAEFERSVAPVAALDPSGGRLPVPARDRYLPGALAARSGAAWGVGVDLLSDDVRARATRRAVATGTVVLSAPVALPTPSRPEGVVLVVPVGCVVAVAPSPSAWSGADASVASPRKMARIARMLSLLIRGSSTLAP